MKQYNLLIFGIAFLVCLAMIMPVAGINTFNRSAATPGSSFFSGLTTLIEPVDATFSKDVEIQFPLSPEDWQQALDVTNGNTAKIEIASFDIPTTTWKRENPVNITTTADGTHVVSITTRHAGLFGVFYTVESVTPAPTPQTFGQIATPAVSQIPATPATAAPVSTPVKAPVSTKPTQSPTLPGILVIGIVGLVGYFVVRKMK